MGKIKDSRASKNFYWSLRPYKKKKCILRFFRILPIFEKKILDFFGLKSPRILVEFNAPNGFCLRQPRLDLYSFSSYFELFPDLTNFLENFFKISLA
jgi:hypothetical protein